MSIFVKVINIAKNEQIILAIIAILFGVIGGFAAIIFLEMITFSQNIFYNNSNRILSLSEYAAKLSWWQLMLIPASGGLIVGLIVHFFIKENRVYGAADVIEASALNVKISFRSGMASALASAITIGCGASAGREGPVVHLAAVLTSKFLLLFNLGKKFSQTLLGCAVASGVAASFNAPFAGIFFALEVITGNYSKSNFTPIVIASVAGTLISRLYFGDEVAFIIPTYHIISFWEFPAFAILGILSAVFSIIFIKSIDFTQKIFNLSHIPNIMRPAFGGLAVGAIAILFPQILGVGYFATDQALNEILPFSLLIMLLIAKLIATSITIGSGFGGGIFSPSLFMGAMLGGTYGVIAAYLIPDLSSGHGVYTIIAMGAVAGAVLGAPMSTIFMVFEMTGDYRLTIGVMIATVIASQIMTHIFKSSFFAFSLEKRGIYLSNGRESRIMRSYEIKDIMRNDMQIIRPDSTMNELRQKLKIRHCNKLFMIDGDGAVMGGVMLWDMADMAFDISNDDKYKAIDIAHINPTLIAIDQNLEDAIHVMGNCQDEYIGVVDNLDSRKLIGILYECDVIRAYHTAVIKPRT